MDDKESLLLARGLEFDSELLKFLEILARGLGFKSDFFKTISKWFNCCFNRRGQEFDSELSNFIFFFGVELLSFPSRDEFSSRA